MEASRVPGKHNVWKRSALVSPPSELKSEVESSIMLERGNYYSAHKEPDPSYRSNVGILQCDKCDTLGSPQSW
jgi:hypothetical protein